MPCSEGGAEGTRTPAPTFTPDAIDVLTSARWTVDSRSNRIGLRLNGPPLERSVSRELPSAGTVFGSIQVTANGQPVVSRRSPGHGRLPSLGVSPDGRSADHRASSPRSAHPIPRRAGTPALDGRRGTGGSVNRRQAVRRCVLDRQPVKDTVVRAPAEAEPAGVERNQALQRRGSLHLKRHACHPSRGAKPPSGRTRPRPSPPDGRVLAIST